MLQLHGFWPSSPPDGTSGPQPFTHAGSVPVQDVFLSCKPEGQAPASEPPAVIDPLDDPDPPPESADAPELVDPELLVEPEVDPEPLDPELPEPELVDPELVVPEPEPVDEPELPLLAPALEGALSSALHPTAIALAVNDTAKKKDWKEIVRIVFSRSRSAPRAPRVFHLSCWVAQPSSTLSCPVAVACTGPQVPGQRTMVFGDCGSS